MKIFILKKKTGRRGKERIKVLQSKASVNTSGKRIQPLIPLVKEISLS